MRRHLAQLCESFARHWTVLGAIGFYVPASMLLATGLLAMVRGSISAHADGLWVFSFAHDLLLGTPIYGWKLSAIPLYFPDLASILTWSGLGFGVGSVMLIHGAISWLLVGVGIA